MLLGGGRKHHGRSKPQRGDNKRGPEDSHSIPSSRREVNVRRTSHFLMKHVGATRQLHNFNRSKRLLQWKLHTNCQYMCFLKTEPLGIEDFAIRDRAWLKGNNCSWPESIIKYSVFLYALHQHRSTCACHRFSLTNTPRLKGTAS